MIIYFKWWDNFKNLLKRVIFRCVQLVQNQCAVIPVFKLEGFFLHKGHW